MKIQRNSKVAYEGIKTEEVICGKHTRKDLHNYIWPKTIYIGLEKLENSKLCPISTTINGLKN